jgi:hypothetical protein
MGGSRNGSAVHDHDVRALYCVRGVGAVKAPRKIRDYLSRIGDRPFEVFAQPPGPNRVTIINSNEGDAKLCIAAQDKAVTRS